MPHAPVSPFSSVLLREFSSQDSQTLRRTALLNDSEQSSSNLSQTHRVPWTPVLNQSNPIYNQASHVFKHSKMENLNSSLIGM